MIAIVVAMFGEGFRWMSDVHWHLTRVYIYIYTGVTKLKTYEEMPRCIYRDTLLFDFTVNIY